MLTYLRTDLFSSPAQTLVNAVNTVGVMGKGIAKSFKDKYPEMFLEYKKVCDSGRLKPGSLMLWRGPDKWVLNFPTKTTWKLPSKPSYLEEGLKRFAAEYEDLGITSISFPPLGCGNGNLSWSEVKPLMERYLENVAIPVYVHDKQVEPDFVPEHLEIGPRQRPADFTQFVSDVRSLTSDKVRSFRLLENGTGFRASLTEKLDLKISGDNGRDIIPREELEVAWSVLQSGVLTGEHFHGESAQDHQRYLISLLAELPYVKLAQVQRAGAGSHPSSHGLFFRESSQTVEADVRMIPLQGRLWV